MVDTKTMGERIKTLRKNRRLTVEECCAACGVSPSAWRMYETGQRVPRDEVKEAISKFFKRSIQTIFFNE